MSVTMRIACRLSSSGGVGTGISLWHDVLFLRASGPGMAARVVAQVDAAGGLDAGQYGGRSGGVHRDLPVTLNEVLVQAA